MMKLFLSILTFAGSFQNFLGDSTLVGFTCLVVRDGKVLIEESAGFQDREKRIPIKNDMIFEVMSMTKPFTVSAALMLVKPERPITTRDWMTHTSGMPEYRPAFMNAYGAYGAYGHSLREATGVDSRLPLVCHPGKCFQYSNTG